MSGPIDQNSNTHFFDGIYQDVWRRMIPPGLTEAEVSFLEDVCNLQPNQAVLDLMCGYGRHALALARKGYTVHAVDSSAGYVQEVQQKATSENLPLTTLLGDVSQMNFSGSFHAAICMGNSFSFFDAASVRRLLQQLYQVLPAGGCFVINTWMIAEIAFRHFQEKVWHQVDGYRYLIASRYLMHPTRIEADHIIVTPAGTVETIQGVDYIFSLAELTAMMQESGFKLQDVFYTPRKRSFQLGDNKAYLVAVRN